MYSFPRHWPLSHYLGPGSLSSMLRGRSPMQRAKVVRVIIALGSIWEANVPKGVSS